MDGQLPVPVVHLTVCRMMHPLHSPPPKQCRQRPQRENHPASTTTGLCDDNDRLRDLQTEGMREGDVRWIGVNSTVIPLSFYLL